METEKKSYSKEFKIKAVELSIQRGSTAIVGDELQIRPDMLRRWVREFKAGKLTGTFDKKPLTQEEQELRNLRRELYETKLERDILKKAVSIFSKSDR